MEEPPDIDLQQVPRRERYWAMGRVAGAQHGIITTAQLNAVGVSNFSISNLRRRHYLHRLYHGVYAVGHTGLSQDGLWLAAVSAVGVDAALTGESAARLWGIWRKPCHVIHVISPRQRRNPSRGRIRIKYSRSLVDLDVTWHRGVRITTVARTLLELGDSLTVHQLANVIHEAAFHRLLDLEATYEMTFRPGRKAASVLAGALRLYMHGSAGTRSNAEDYMLLLLKRAGVPEPAVNTHHEIDDEPSLELDCCWPDRKLVVEVDGGGHRRPPSMRRDGEQSVRLRRAGWTLIRIPPMQLRSRLHEITAHFDGDQTAGGRRNVRLGKQTART